MKKTHKFFLIIAISLLCVALLSGCGRKDDPNWNGTDYFDENGNIIEDDEQITLDFIAQRHYNKNFNDIQGKNKEANREDVIQKYLSYHLPKNVAENEQGNVQPLLDMFFNDQEKITDVTLDPALAKASSDIDTISAAVAMAEYLASNNAEFENFVGTVRDKVKVIDALTTAARAHFMVLDLANNNLSNPEEYCTDLIDALALITKDIPIFGKYFEKTLSCTRKGVEVVINTTEIKKTFYEQLAKSLDGSTFFEFKNFEIILDPNRWEDSGAPTVSQILDRMLDPTSGFNDLNPNGLECVRGYLLNRVQREQQNSGEQDEEIDSENEKKSAIAYNGHRYKAYDMQMSWHDAKEYCESLGGHLATITSAEEQAFLENFGGNYWIGATDEENEGSWVWVTGEAWGYENWREGEPNNKGTENYLTIWPDTWNDLCVDSWEQSGFICEWDSVS